MNNAHQALLAFHSLTPLVGRDDAHATAIFETAKRVHDLSNNGDFPFAYVFSDYSMIVADEPDSEPRIVGCHCESCESLSTSTVRVSA